MTMTLDRTVETAVTVPHVDAANARRRPPGSTGGSSLVATAMDDGDPNTGRVKCRVAKRKKRKKLTPAIAHQAFEKWRPVGRSLFWRSNLPRHLLGDFLHDAFVRLLLYYVHAGVPVSDAGAVLTTTLLNLIRNDFRRKKPQQLQEWEIVDPSSERAQEHEDREHAKHTINQILQAASPEEQKATRAFLATNDHRHAVDLLLKEEGVLAPSEVEWNRRHSAYRASLTRFRGRGRDFFDDDELP